MYKMETNHEIPMIEAILGSPLSDKELDELIKHEIEFKAKYNLPLTRYNNAVEKEIDEEIEKAYRRVPIGKQISYLKGVEEFRYYITKKYLIENTNNK